MNAPVFRGNLLTGGRIFQGRGVYGRHREDLKRILIASGPCGLVPEALGRVRGTSAEPRSCAAHSFRTEGALGCGRPPLSNDWSWSWFTCIGSLGGSGAKQAGTCCCAQTALALLAKSARPRDLRGFWRSRRPAEPGTICCRPRRVLLVHPQEPALVS